MNRVAIPFIVLCIAALSTRADEPPAVKLIREEQVIRVEIGGKPFTTYHYADDIGRPYTRPYFFPVLATDGTGVTSDQLTGGGDHPHHRSLWVAQGDVNGADQWSFTSKTPPKQRNLGFDKVEGDTIQQRLAWEGKEGQPILNETRTVRFFAWPDGTRGMDFTLAFTPVDGDVTFGDTKEAGLVAVRVAKSIAAKPMLTNSAGGAGEKQVWGKPAEWCDLSGQIDGKPYGVAVFDHPENPRHPGTWHARDYGLLAANIFGLHEFDPKLPKGAGDFKIEKGKTVTFRYRVVIHEGDAAAAKLNEKYKDFAGGK